MLAKKGSIIVTVDPDEKVFQKMGDLNIQVGKGYNTNFRERNPSMAFVLEGLGEIKTGSWIMTNYLHFGSDSPYLLTDNVYAIPVDEELFALIDDSGDVKKVVNGNLVVELVDVEKKFVPQNYVGKYEDRGKVIKGNSHYKAGDFVLFLYKANLEMSYVWKGIEKRFVRIHENEVVGTVKW